MEAIVDEPLGDVFDLDARRRLERAGVENALVSHEPVLPGVQQLHGAGEPPGHVVGVEDRNFGGVRESRPAHHADVHPRDREDRGAAPRRR